MNAPQQRDTQRLIVILQKGYDVVPTVNLIFPIQIYNYIFSYTTIFIVFFSKKFPTTEIGQVGLQKKATSTREVAIIYKV